MGFRGLGVLGFWGLKPYLRQAKIEIGNQKIKITKKARHAKTERCKRCRSKDKRLDTRGCISMKTDLCIFSIVSRGYGSNGLGAIDSKNLFKSKQD